MSAEAGIRGCERERGGGGWGEAGRDGLISSKEKVDCEPETRGEAGYERETWTEERGINGDAGRERETD